MESVSGASDRKPDIDSAEEGRNPLDLAASLEYEVETHRARGDEAEHVLTPRLVISRDIFPALNTR